VDAEVWGRGDPWGGLRRVVSEEHFPRNFWEGASCPARARPTAPHPQVPPLPCSPGARAPLVVLGARAGQVRVPLPLPLPLPVPLDSSSSSTTTSSSSSSGSSRGRRGEDPAAPRSRGSRSCAARHPRAQKGSLSLSLPLTRPSDTSPWCPWHTSPQCPWHTSPQCPWHTSTGCPWRAAEVRVRGGVLLRGRGREAGPCVACRSGDGVGGPEVRRLLAPEEEGVVGKVGQGSREPGVTGHELWQLLSPPPPLPALPCPPGRPWCVPRAPGPPLAPRYAPGVPPALPTPLCASSLLHLSLPPSPRARWGSEASQPGRGQAGTATRGALCAPLPLLSLFSLFSLLGLFSLPQSAHSSTAAPSLSPLPLSHSPLPHPSHAPSLGVRPPQPGGGSDAARGTTSQSHSLHPLLRCLRT